MNPLGNVFKMIYSLRERNISPEEKEKLRELLDKLSERERNILTRTLQEQVLDEKIPIWKLFVVCKMLKLMSLAYGTAVVLQLIQGRDNIGGILFEPLSLEDLRDLGIAEVKTVKIKGRDKLKIVHYVGRERLEEAAKKLRQQKKLQPALVIERHLRRKEKRNFLKEALQESLHEKTEEKLKQQASE